MIEFSGRVGIQQRVLPSYRAPFFDKLAHLLRGNVCVFAGEPQQNEAIDTSTLQLKVAKHIKTANIHIFKGKAYLCWQHGFIRWIKTWQPDALIIEANPRIISNYQAMILLRLWNRPIIGWGLGYLDWAFPRWALALRTSVLKQFYNSFDALIAYSTKGAEDYIRLGISAKKVFVAHNAVSNEQAEKFYQEISRTPNLLIEWERSLGLSNKPIVLSVGRLLPSKRLHDLIQACATLSDRCQLLIIGDGPERYKLRMLAKQILPSARFLGHRTGQELGLCFGSADLFVLPGSGGLAVQEAMIYGKPVIVAEGDGTQRDLVQEGKNGFFIKTGDVPSLTRLIKSCLDNSESLSYMGQQSRMIVTQKFNLNQMVKTFIQVINFVTSKSRYPRI